MPERGLVVNASGLPSLTRRSVPRVVKRLWGFTKVRYRGLAKNSNRALVAQAIDGTGAPGMGEKRAAGPCAATLVGRKCRCSFTHAESASVCARVDENNGLFSVPLSVRFKPYDGQHSFEAVARLSPPGCETNRSCLP